ncbi:bidirectional sugar transporter SWEET14-like [Nymphaea colorata]|nr:bidirectional sugar transporter SWEET14-like [Nymphaea colorata]
MVIAHPLAFAFGLLGNIVSFMVYLAPVPTFYRIFKKKSTEGFQAVPYVVALFSAMLWIYYALLKSNAFLLITINTVGCVIESIYIIMFIIYAAQKARNKAIKLLLVLNVGVFSFILLTSFFFSKGAKRLQIMGWVCAAFAVSVSAAPLSIMRLVIRTKSVEYMPFSLSFFLTLSSVMWFAYGMFIKDLFVALPNVLGFSFGTSQMILYAIYMNKGKTNVAVDQELPQVTAVKPSAVGGAPDQIHPVDIEPELSRGSAVDSQKRAELGGVQAAPNAPSRKGDDMV